MASRQQPRQSKDEKVPQLPVPAVQTAEGPANGIAGADAAAAQPVKRGFQPHHAKSVPKLQNLGAQATSGATSGVPVTTMMLRNIPNKYTQTKLLQEIDECGFAGTYDFFYLPMDVHNKSNVGYAFVNFKTPEVAARFSAVCSNRSFLRFRSRKVGIVSAAHVQGLDANLRHFQDRAVTQAKNDQYRPIVLKGNQVIKFEDAVAEARSQSVEDTSGEASPTPSAGNVCPTSAAGGGLVGLSGARQGLEAAIQRLLAINDFNDIHPSNDVHAEVAFSDPIVGSDQQQLPRNQFEDDIEIPKVPPMPVRLLQAGGSSKGTVHSEAFRACLDFPAGVSKSSTSKLTPAYNMTNDSTFDEWNCSTPRTNDVILGTSLNHLAPDEVWRSL